MNDQAADDRLSNTGAAAAPEHVPLHAGSDFTLWAWSCLRAAGFPCVLALRLAASEAARAADALTLAEEKEAEVRSAVLDALRADGDAPAPDVLQRLRRARKAVSKGRSPEPADVVGIAEGPLEALLTASADVGARRAELDRTFAEGRLRASEAIRDLARDPLFREAVTWQNRQVIGSAFDSLLRAPPEQAMGSKHRQHEELIANYLHRYATKNDTIGFFGPVGWARLDGDSETRIVARPGSKLLASRTTYLEQWGIDVLVAKLSKDERLWPWLRPRRFGFLRLVGSRVESPLTGNEELPRTLELALRASEGLRTVRELALALSVEFPVDFATKADVESALRTLREKKLAAISLEFPLQWEPAAALRAELERIGDAALRDECMSGLVALEEARDVVARAVGNAEQLAAALAHLDETFTRLTGAEATRHAGAMYASRSLVFEDARRDLGLTVGKKLLVEIGPTLDLVLTSARYVTHAAARAYGQAFREIFDAMTKKSGATSVSFADFWFRIGRLFAGAHRPIDAVERDVADRWARILTVRGDERRADFRSAELGAAVKAAFESPGPGWSMARYHSPDVMIAAPSVEAIERGEYLAVLGEIHVSMNTLLPSLFCAQHPNVSELEALLEGDLGGPIFYRIDTKDGLRDGSIRMARGIDTSQGWDIETGFEASTRPRDRVVRLGELELELEGERLVVVGNGGRLRSDVLEVVGPTILGLITVNALTMLPDLPHTPRVTIDNVVVHRESWKVDSAEMACAFVDSEQERFVAVRRWAHTLGIPRFAYMKSSLEVKPIYIDFDSPIAVSIFAKIVRRAKEHVSGTATLKISEMLPTLEDTWLPDAAGQKYTSELRLVAVDGLRPA